MKFLCENCKAKYQIADDKVAGKTVRMKCRKCGHLIEIRASAALAEATAFRSLPSEELSRIVDEPHKLAASLTSSTPAPTSASTPAPAPTSAAPKPAPRPAPAAAPRRPAPRPGAGATAPMRAMTPAPSNTSTAAALAPVASEPPAADKSSGGLASAFSMAVANDPPADMPVTASGSFDMGDAGTNDEWYSGINGVPVGPMRLSELRSKIASGQVTEESLVWREGFEEWVALRTVPALMELARSPQGERTSLAPAARNRPKDTRNNVVPLRTESPKPMGDESTAIFSGLNVLAALNQPAEKPEPAPTFDASPSAPVAPVAAVAVSDPFATSDPFGASSSATSSAPVAPLSFEPSPVAASGAVGLPVAPPPAAPATRIPPVVWVVVALALAVGLTGGSMLSKKETQTQVQIVTVEKVVNTPAPDVTTGTDPSTAPTVDPTASAKKVTVGPGPKTGPTSTATATAVATPGPIAVVPTGGPSPLPTSTPAVNSTETIPASKLQEIVNGQRNSIRRVCWDPMVSSGAASGSVKASISLNISNGQVTSVNVSGVDGRLGSCIQSRVKGWQFPTGYAPTSTSFVLAFVSQG